jgi:hypothetical protein
LLKSANDSRLQDRLLYVMTVLADENARSTVAEMLADTSRRGEFPPASLISAAAKLRFDELWEVIKAILADANRDRTELTKPQVLAAFAAALILEIDVSAEAHQFARKRWSPRLQLALRAAVRAMANRPENSSALREGIIRTLQQAAVYEWSPETLPATAPQMRLTTPLSSAEAAVALWEMKVPFTERTIRAVAAQDDPSAGDYLAWELSQRGGDEAFELALAMLPAPRVSAQDTHPRVYNENERCAGAMLLALAARTKLQVERASERIESRLTGGPFGREDDFLVRGTYQCALLILGESDLRQTVRELLHSGDFPRRRAMTALLVAGDRYALDWLLLDPRVTDETVTQLLLDDALADVLHACAPQLPVPNAAAGSDLRDWCVRILRDTYAIRRDTIKLCLRDPEVPE